MTLKPPSVSKQLSLERLFNKAITMHRSGKLPVAERLYRTIIRIQPRHPAANHNLGVLIMQSGRPYIALPHFKTAIQSAPEQHQYWRSYFDALINCGQDETAFNILQNGIKHGLPEEQIKAMIARLEQPVSQNSDTSSPNCKNTSAIHEPIHEHKMQFSQTANAPTVDEIMKIKEQFDQKHFHDAELLIRGITERFPDYGKGWQMLGTNLIYQKRFEEALEPNNRAAQLLPVDALTHFNLGICYYGLGRIKEAISSYRFAVHYRPDFAEAHNNLGVALMDLGLLKESLAAIRKALRIKPDYAIAFNNLGNTFTELGQFNHAEESIRRALELDPNYSRAYFNLGNTLRMSNRLYEAESCYRKALTIEPDCAEFYCFLSATLGEIGNIEEALLYAQRAVELNPSYQKAYDNYLFILSYSDNDPSQYLQEARKYGQMVAENVAAPFTQWNCSPQPERLRVGLVSGDLRNHPVGFFIEGILGNIDQKRIELIAYPSDYHEDELTNRIKPFFSAWKPLIEFNNTAAARLIHNDGVHILLDLSGHTANNRLPLFAWKPAPVQTSWLGYFASTGLPGMDYLLADYIGVPEDHTVMFTEKVWYLPDTRLCFTPLKDNLPVSELPALKNGYITFGSFQSITKIGDRVLLTWQKIFAALPDARLRLQCKRLGNDAVKERIMLRLAQFGISPDRIILHGYVPRSDYLTAHAEVDIILDTFPYPGGTTTCDALWMGVPTITLVGKTLLARQGASILTVAGLSELVAPNESDYVAKAISLSENLPRLAALRSGLRKQVLASPLFDTKLFAHNLVDALWGMWREGFSKNSPANVTP